MTDLHTRAEAIAADPKREHSCSRLLFDLRHELLAVVRAAKQWDTCVTRYPDDCCPHQLTCQDQVQKALAAYDAALERELGETP